MTLPQARRQVWIRGFYGVVIMALAAIWVVLVGVKDLYRRPPSRLFPVPGEQHLRQFIGPLVEDSAVLAWLWGLLPTWNWVYTLWIFVLWFSLGAWLVHSAQELYGDIRLTRRERQRDEWGRSLGGARLAQETRPMVIDAVSEDHWYKKPTGIVGLGVVVQMVTMVIKWLLGL